MSQEFEDPDQLCLEGSLILADPSLTDPGFARSVLLLTDHSHSTGAMGYILNKPIGKSVRDLVADEDFGSLADVPVYLGGPVTPEHLTFASIAWDAKQSSLDFSSQLSAEEAAHRLAEGFCVRAFVGYSGWSEGQLESELQRRSWIARRPEARVLSGDSVERLWSDLLSTMGPWYQLLANTPDDVSLN